MTPREMTTDLETGDGFSVEQYYVSQLPEIKPCNGKVNNWVFEDNTESWCDGLRFGIIKWFEGDDVKFDFSKIRPSGSILKTKGGSVIPTKEICNIK